MLIQRTFYCRNNEILICYTLAAENGCNTSFLAFPTQVYVMIAASEVDIRSILCYKFSVVKLYHCLD